MKGCKRAKDRSGQERGSMEEYNNVRYLMYLHLQAMKMLMNEIERIREKIKTEPEKLTYEESEMISEICYAAIDNILGDEEACMIESMLSEELKVLFNDRGSF